MFQKIAKFIQKYKLDLVLFILHIPSVSFAFNRANLIPTPWFLLLIGWVPLYYIFVNEKVSDENYNVVGDYYHDRYTLARLFSALFVLPIIGPIIAIMRINYLKDEIKQKNKVK